MDTPSTHDRRDRAPERALVALASALILVASTRVALPLVIFVVTIGLLALPMSSLIAWLSRFDPSPPGDDDDGAFAGPDGPQAADGDGAAGGVVAFVREPAEPLPRPIRPIAPEEPRLRRLSA